MSSPQNSMKARRDTTPAEPFRLLDKDEIEKRRVPLSEAELGTQREYVYRCAFCKKRYTSERLYERHACRERDRHNLLNSVEGAAAFSFYNLYFNLKGRSSQSREAFEKSRYFNSLIKFAKFVKTAKITSPEKYVEIMVQATYDPVLWCNAEAIQLYHMWLDQFKDPLENLVDNIFFLKNLAEKENVTISELPAKLGPQGIINLLRSQNLSPWVLFKAPSFVKYIKSGELDQSHKDVIDRSIDMKIWLPRMTPGEELDAAMQIIKEAGL